MSAKKMGLGRGLNTLIPKAPIVDDEDVEQVKKRVSKSSKTKKKEEPEKELTLPIDKIEPNPDQPRNQFDEDTLQELADSIKQYGMLQPILVTPKDDFYEIIAGERRWRAAKLAGLNEVKTGRSCNESKQEPCCNYKLVETFETGPKSTENAGRRDDQYRTCESIAGNLKQRSAV